MLAALVIASADDSCTTSAGSCYNAGGSHNVECNVAESDCPAYWYEPGYVSGMSGCCHCSAGCDHSLETESDCTYYSCASAEDDDDDGDDDHDDGDDDDGDDATTDPPTATPPLSAAATTMGLGLAVVAALATATLLRA